MPLKIESIKVAGTQYDGRAKLSEDQRQAIRILAREGYSQRKLASMFGVSKRLIQSIITPPTRTPAKKRTKEYWSEVKKDIETKNSTYTNLEKSNLKRSNYGIKDRNLQKDVMSAYKSGNEEVKNMLTNLFPDMDFKANVMDRIKTWEDVCNELNIPNGWENDLALHIYDTFHFNEGEMKCAIAHMKILAIAKALNEGWKLTKDAKERKEGYGVYWVRRDGVRGDVDFQVSSDYYLGYVRVTSSFGRMSWLFVPQLSFRTQELAEYAVLQFPDIWREYYNNYEQDKR